MGEIRTTETDTAPENTLINLPESNEILVTVIYSSLHKHLEYHDRTDEVFPTMKRSLKILEPKNETSNISTIRDRPTPTS